MNYRLHCTFSESFECLTGYYTNSRVDFGKRAEAGKYKTIDIHNETVKPVVILSLCWR